eukprot:Gb_12889 [translate_table: standard]
MDSKDYIDMPSVTQSLLEDLAKLRELLDKFEVFEESKEAYRKEEQPWNECLDIPKFDLSRLEYLFKEIEINAHNNKDKDSNCKTLEAQGKEYEEETVEINDVTIPVNANELELEVGNIQNIIMDYKKTSIEHDEEINNPIEPMTNSSLLIPTEEDLRLARFDFSCRTCPKGTKGPHVTISIKEPIMSKEKTMHEEPLIFTNKAKAKNVFGEILKSLRADSSWTWAQTMCISIHDKRYGLDIASYDKHNLQKATTGYMLGHSSCKEAQYLVKINKKLGQFLEQHKPSLVFPVTSAIVLASKSYYPSNRAKQKHKFEKERVKGNKPKDYDHEIDKEAKKEIIDRESEEEARDENFETKGKRPKRFIKSVPKRRVDEENVGKKEVTTKVHSESVKGELLITANSLFLGRVVKCQINKEKTNQEATIGTKISNTLANASCPKLDYLMNTENLEELNFFQKTRHAQVTDKEEKMGSRETILKLTKYKVVLHLTKEGYAVKALRCSLARCIRHPNKDAIHLLEKATYLNTLKDKFERPNLQNPRGRSHLPGVDAFASTEDPEKEFPPATDNYIRPILATKYLEKKLFCYLSNESRVLVIFKTLAEAASLAGIWIPSGNKHSIMPSNSEHYFNINQDYTKNKARANLVKKRRRDKREYGEFRIPVSIQNYRISPTGQTNSQRDALSRNVTRDTVTLLQIAIPPEEQTVTTNRYKGVAEVIPFCVIRLATVTR